MQISCFRSPWGVKHKAIFCIDNKQAAFACMSDKQIALDTSK